MGENGRAPWIQHVVRTGVDAIPDVLLDFVRCVGATRFIVDAEGEKMPMIAATRKQNHRHIGRSPWL